MQVTPTQQQNPHPGTQPLQTAQNKVRPRFRSQRSSDLNESVIREMTRLAFQHNAVNLAQGFPDFPAPQILKDAAARAIAEDHNQYTITWGSRPFREAIAEKYARCYNLGFDPDREVTVVCGSTEGMFATLMGITNPGDELIIFEPYYENYGPDSILCGAKRKYVKLRAPDWTFDPAELRAAFSAKTKGIIINTPNNPTGKIFTRAELEYIASLCQEFDALAITDEIYEHILFDGAEHVCMMTLPGMRDRTIVVNSLSKTYSVTGWRVGYVVAAPDLTESIRKVHDFLTVNAAAPLQAAGIVALSLPDPYYTDLAQTYTKKRAVLTEILTGAGFDCFRPGGAYYVMTEISRLGYPTDVACAMDLVENFGVAAVPASCFFSDPKDGSRMVRFCFAKKPETLAEAGTRLKRFAAARGLT
jgi:aminotransferase